MYSITEDEFQSLRNTCKTQNYQLFTLINQNYLEIQLTVNKKVSTLQDPRKFTSKISIEDLQQFLRDKFENIKNLQAFLADSNNLNVNLQNGSIQLVISTALSNGKLITTKLGELKLKEVLYDQERYLSEIFIMCHSKVTLTENNYKYMFREFVNMFRVLFQRVKTMEEKQTQSHIYSSSNNATKQITDLLREETYRAKCQQYDIYNRKKSENISYKAQERRLSLNQYPSGGSSFGTSPIKYSKEEKEETGEWKKEMKKIQNICGKNKQKRAQLEEIMKQVKEELKKEIEILKKQLKVQSILKIHAGKRENVQSFKLMKDLDKQKQIEEKIQQLDFKLKELKTSYNQVINMISQFSEAVIKKMENFGQKSEIFEDKFSKVIEQLDLRIERRIIQQSGLQIKDKLIDITSPFFQQFQLKGTNIEYRGQDSKSTILLGKVKMSEKNCFSIKIIKTLVSNIQIGIADAEYRTQRDCWTLPNFIVYVGWSSTIYEGPNDMLLKQGAAISQGDIISVRANTETGLIQWLVAGQLRAKIVWEKLKDKSIKWVPMVRFYDHGDVISWVTEKMYHS